ncbi:MAG: ATP-binding protein [Acidimicrobiales bacterium]|jgi:predicted ATPase/DNA-binding SARP family transcriptional activator
MLTPDSIAASHASPPDDLGGAPEWNSSRAGLYLRLLGSLTVEIDGVARPLRYGKSKALLAYLAVQARPLVRTTIASEFWESLPADRARANLRVVLNDLRAALGPYILIDRSTISLNRDLPVTTDVMQIGRAFSATGGDPIGREMAELLATVSGEFLEGIELRDAPDIETFVETQRVRMQRLSADAMLAILGTGDDPQGVDAAIDDELVLALVRRLGAMEPWHEEGRRVAMRTLLRLGQPGAALATYEEFRDGLLAGFELSPEPETIALAEQIAAKAGVQMNPAMSTKKLAKATTPIFGRDVELLTIEEALDSGHRLITVTGPGGVGKSRLALEAAWRVTQPDIAHGITEAVTVDLSGVTADTDLALVTATALGIPFAGYRAPLAELLSVLGDRSIVIVLDNGAHVIGVIGPFVEALLSACAGVRIILTSRIPLRTRSEMVFPLRALPVPEPGADADALAANPAVLLVMARARAIGAPVDREDLPAVASMCRQVEGLPLALELITTQLRLIDPNELAGTLSSALDEFADDATDRPSRQRTLRRSIRWSYDLLGEDEQRVFRLLGVFRGGAAIGAVAALIPPGAGGWPAVVRVVDAWLVQRADGPGGTRLTMSKAIQVFAREMLISADEMTSVSQRHAQVFLDFAEQAESSLRGPEQATWLARLEVELDNLRAALTHLLDQGNVVDALRMTNALSSFWQIHGHTAEGLSWFARATTLDPGTEPAVGAPNLVPLLARAHSRAALLAIRSLDAEAADQQIEMARRLAPLAPDPDIDGELLYAEMYAALIFDRRPEGAALLDRIDPAVAAAEQSGRRWEAARFRHTQAWLSMVHVDLAEARRLARLAQAGFEECGDGGWAALASVVIATLDALEGRPEAALRTLHDAYRTLLAVNDLTSSTYALASGSSLLALIGHDEASARVSGAVSAVMTQTGMKMPAVSRGLEPSFRSDARGRLGEDAWSAAWQAGHEVGYDVDWGPLP